MLMMLKKKKKMICELETLFLARSIGKFKSWKFGFNSSV